MWLRSNKTLCVKWARPAPQVMELKGLVWNLCAHIWCETEDIPQPRPPFAHGQRSPSAVRHPMHSSNETELESLIRNQKLQRLWLQCSLKIPWGLAVTSGQRDGPAVSRPRPLPPGGGLCPVWSPVFWVRGPRTLPRPWGPSFPALPGIRGPRCCRTHVVG